MKDFRPKKHVIKPREFNGSEKILNVNDDNTHHLCIKASGQKQYRNFAFRTTLSLINIFDSIRDKFILNPTCACHLVYPHD